ncbi:MAG: GAF domain-containing sensor histidine kinase [Deltaproteobacteria bacterium]|nr:GAF domain-containing sensor histidine kinase [Deltaproteobacteria bacterium]MBW2047803.1 GAF domain-containing sensor histidine kinase [Deltaproteobacteria bacterium]MBW2111221.1 GAF domain-containing sensor histidine kinase [Deltaproteobacteria bacterium]MBW2352388.1 GAF domain-containing sensor histidine kinase [Deltaproteobacteria bacterium]HDZ89716.1 GAF domain-containing protein [Deltaproteobacteria bacterium]
MLKDLKELAREIRQEPWAKSVSAEKDFWPLLMQWIDEHVVAEFIERLVGQIDEIVDIDPDLPEPQILERATRYMVEFLGAHSASVRIYDPQTGQMLSYGSYPSKEDMRATFIPFDDSIAGEVVKTRLPYLASDLSREKRYTNKDVLHKGGFQSLMAIPFEIQRFSPRDRDTVGVIQIYFPEKNRYFGHLEVQAAITMAKRLSFVIARKKILSMYRIDEKKEMIVRHIFRKLGSRGGVKLDEVFNRVVPELADIVDLQSCTLFSVTEGLDRVILQAGFPEDGYHSVGRVIPVASEPVFELLLNLREYSGDSVYEVVTPSHIFVVDPQRSALISDNLKKFAALHNINSILYLPLGYEGEITHLMAIDALDQRQRYSTDEVDIFLFLGSELMKAQKMERLDDALHDFKNPAIAIAGFARRLKEILRNNKLEQSGDQVEKYVDILLHETSRLQELAMSIYRVGDEQAVNLSEVLKRRVEINREAIKEQLRQNVSLKEGPYDPDIMVMCHAVHMERVFDNLLNNATKAIPLKGGVLAVRTYRDGQWACAEISNTGEISEDDRMKILEGEGEGRGLYITYRIMRLLKGKIDIRTGGGTTTFVVSFPVYTS